MSFKSEGPADWTILTSQCRFPRRCSKWSNLTTGSRFVETWAVTAVGDMWLGKEGKFCLILWLFPCYHLLHVMVRPALKTDWALPSIEQGRFVLASVPHQNSYIYVGTCQKISGRFALSNDIYGFFWHTKYIQICSRYISTTTQPCLTVATQLGPLRLQRSALMLLKAVILQPEQFGIQIGDYTCAFVVSQKHNFPPPFW